MQSALVAAQIVVAVLLILLIIVQVKGTGFGRVWGTWTTSFSRRGLERLVFRATFVVSFLFILLSALALI